MRSMQQISPAAAFSPAPLALALGRPAFAQGAPIKIGLMLPFSGTFAALGENIAATFELYLQEHGDKLGGRKM